MPPAKKTAAKKTGGTRPHRPQPSQPRDEGDVFMLNQNGTVRCRWRDSNVLLWTPTIGEYEELLVEYADTRDWYGVEGRTVQEAYSRTAPNALLWVKIIDVLGDNDEPIEAKDLASWMLTGDSLEKLVVHWRVNPLARGETQDLIQQVAAAAVAQLQAGATKPSTSPDPASPESEGT